MESAPVPSDGGERAVTSQAVTHCRLLWDTQLEEEEEVLPSPPMHAA